MCSRLRRGLRFRSLLEEVVDWWRKSASFRSLSINAGGLGLFSAESAVEEFSSGCREIVL